MGNSCTSVFPNIHAREQQELNTIKKHTQAVKRGVRMERNKGDTKKKVPKAYHFPFHRAKRAMSFSMAVGKGELMRECLPKHSRIGTARIK